MKYWWVNHKKTSKHEIAGGFLWSPMRNQNGARNQFYDNMRNASPGDALISYSHAEIRFYGLITDFAIPSPKPPSFGTTGDNWDKKNGWLLPVKWKAMAAPMRPKDRIHEFSGFLPEKYSPIHPLTGNGGQNAYLAEINKRIFDLLVGEVDFDDEHFSFPQGSMLSVMNEIDSSIEDLIFKDGAVDSTTKEMLVAARVGQGVFKKRISEFERSCRLTRLETSSLLIASHIKPWRLCDTASERLDGANGLLLAPHVDLLFDRGLISFTDEGDVLVSSRLRLVDLDALGLKDACGVRGKAFQRRQAVYLRFHRDNIFLV